jgi:hypothetical protein
MNKIDKELLLLFTVRSKQVPLHDKCFIPCLYDHLIMANGVSSSLHQRTNRTKMSMHTYCAC